MTDLQSIVTDKIPNLRVYRPKRFTEKDYQGCLNLNLAEKALIIQAATKCKGDKYLMAVALRIHVRTLFNKIIQHSLDKHL